VKKKQYTNEFKTEAVRLAEQSKESTSQVAREMGVAPSILCRWVREFGTKPDGTAAITPNEHEELILLRRKLARITEERDILKKAIGIFTKELP
jgi:transposase